VGFIYCKSYLFRYILKRVGIPSLPGNFNLIFFCWCSVIFGEKGWAFNRIIFYYCFLSEGLCLLENVSGDRRCVLESVASRVKSVLPFVKVAYPEVRGGTGIGLLQPLNPRDRRVCRQRLKSSVDRAMNRNNCLYDIVYDLDVLAAACSANSVPR